MNISTLSQNIANKLNIDSNILLNVIKSNLNETQLNSPITDPELLKNINNLINIDGEINDIEQNLKENETKNNFNKLKENLGKLQILVLIKNLEKSKSCDSVVKSLLNVLNNKFESVNNILESDLKQHGGTNENYYNKYLKYKIKYLKLLGGSTFEVYTNDIKLPNV
jgi:hypothetical protein